MKCQLQKGTFILFRPQCVNYSEKAYPCQCEMTHTCKHIMEMLLIQHAMLILQFKWILYFLNHFLPRSRRVISLWPNGAIWWRGSALTLTQLMAWCLMTPRHKLKQCWLIISEVIPLRAISQEMHKISVLDRSLKITHLTHWGWDKMAAIFQTTFSYVFSWKKMNDIRLKFHWRLFLRLKLTIFQHWFR